MANEYSRPVLRALLGPQPAADVRRPYTIPGTNIVPKAARRFPAAPPPPPSYGLNRMQTRQADIMAQRMMRGEPTPAPAPAGPQMPPKAGIFNQPLMSPTGLGISSAALAGLEYGGPSLQPTSFGQGLARMGAAGLQAFAQAKQAEAASAMKKRELDAEIAYKAGDLAIKAAKMSGPFSGTSMSAQDRNNVLTLGPKIKDGSATDTEKQIYRVSYAALSAPRDETRVTDQGTTIVRVPGMDLSSFPTPEGYSAGERVIGKTSAKFSEGQSNAAAFANRMNAGLEIFDELTKSGYDPTNMQDFLAGNLPRSVSGFASTPEGQRYSAAKTDFITAVLRKESGAAISASEFEKEDRKYFPQPGEGQDVVEQKRLARDRALQSMIAQSGPAYYVLFGDEAESEIPTGAKFLKRVGGKSFYETPNGKIIVVE